MSIRQSLNLTQKDIAQALGVTEQTVRNWEQGKAVPRLTITQTKTLCSLLQMTIEQIPDSFGPKPQTKNA